jgi:hypothetical protein
MSIPATLSANQRSVVRGLIEALEQVPGFQGAALGGSHAGGLARADSDHGKLVGMVGISKF